MLDRAADLLFYNLTNATTADGVVAAGGGLLAPHAHTIGRLLHGVHDHRLLLCSWFMRRDYPGTSRHPSLSAPLTAALLELHADVDALLCASGPFLLARSLDDAAHLAAAYGDDAAFYDRMARAQVTTWLPACQTVDEFAGGVCSIHVTPDAAPPLADYANKVAMPWRGKGVSASSPLRRNRRARADCAGEAWGGLVANYYGGRVACYAAQAASDLGAGAPLNATAYMACVDALGRDFQADVTRATYPLCDQPTGDALAMSRALIAKYGPLFE